MKLSEYVDCVRQTAFYEDMQTYPVYGLIGETGEFLDKMFPVWVDGCLTTISREESIKELGDILWYVVSLARDFSIPIQDLAARVTGGTLVDTFDELQNDRMSTDQRDPYILLAIHVCSLAERSKKLLRDKKPITREAVLETLRRVLLAMMYICDLEMFTLDEVAEANTVKLRSRKDRGVLGGDGDNR